MKDNYQPSQKILSNYANILVNYALNSGKGVKKGEVVQVMVPDIAKPLALEIRNALLKSGAHPILRLEATGFEKDFYNLADDGQTNFFPKKFLKAKADLLDHSIVILADPNPYILADIDPHKVIKSRDSQKKYRDWLIDKENHGKFSWVVASWGVDAKAKIVGLSLEEYWQQIIKACFLDDDNPIAKWQAVSKLQTKIKNSLNKMKIKTLLVKGKNINLEVSLGEKRIWRGGEGRNIPSFEIFTSPDWRGIKGQISFNQPVYRYGNLIEGISLKIEDGLVVKAQAQKGNQFLQTMLKSKNADKIGEFSLTDKRMSRINHPMAEIIFDENMGGPYGNMHLAIGMAYKDCYSGNKDKMTTQKWADLGFNDAAEHTDMISTADRTVTAILADGSRKVIYEKGQFIV